MSGESLFSRANPCSAVGLERRTTPAVRSQSGSWRRRTSLDILGRQRDAELLFQLQDGLRWPSDSMRKVLLGGREPDRTGRHGQCRKIGPDPIENFG